MIKTLVGSVLVATLASTSGVLAAAEGPSENTPRVFAHYMVCFGGTTEFDRREVTLAHRYGIDGFALNAGEWKQIVARPKKIEDTNYVPNADNMYQAAKEVSPDFKLFLSPDFAGGTQGYLWQVSEFTIDDMVRRYREHPNQFYYGGKQFFSGYSGDVLLWRNAKDRLKAGGMDVTLVPALGLGRPWQTMLNVERVMDLFRDDSPYDGIFRFACDDSVRNIIDQNALFRRLAIYRNKLYMAGACPAYCSPNLRDFQGMRGYISMWEGLIRDRPDLVEIVTWNDYNEDSNLMPSSRALVMKTGVWDKRHLNRDESYLDVTAFYSAWLKTGVRPPITQDKLYFSYRDRSREMTKEWDEQDKKWNDIHFALGNRQIHDDVRDTVNVTAFLTAPAQLEIIQGDRVDRFALDAGVVFADAPIRPGCTPQFRLTRGNAAILDVLGRKSIIRDATEQNSAQATTRTWMSGAAVGKPQHVFALNDKLLKPGAEPLVIDTPNMGDASYNFRLTYRNPGDTEARLTLYVNDAATNKNAAKDRFPIWFPLTLPPTGGEFKTISFLWSTWDAKTRFTIASETSEDPKLQNGGFSDFGEVTLRKLELIPLHMTHPVPAPKTTYPELVRIPGGEFIMGGPGGNIDETPARKVRISPLAIGKYEITNEEFERFMPEHRRLRDGYSWRDREPAIYISWMQAARYCNWLSAQNGLTPAYNETTWKLDREANGFRLPTEAEWEYVASGRGENRVYPWGNDAPTPDRGNFQLTPLDTSSQRQASVGGGVCVVGDFPKGASRDGVMDLAGNAAEWCADAFGDYSATAGTDANAVVTDPLCEISSPHRVIRGGSWGYYNHSQRVRDREFNNPGFGGYIYIGFRVVLPAKGLEKLNIGN